MPSSLPRTHKLLPLLVLLPVLFSCGRSEKSPLVSSLEAIFYDPGFAAVPTARFPAADYGAVGDSQTVNTAAIQAAIDAASEAGGGVVSFEQGTYLSGALFVKSNVELHLDEGVSIRAIHDEEAYPDVWTRVAGIEMEWPAGLINVYEQENVRITGKGTIDGNGKFWWDKFWGDPPRSGGMWTDYNARGIRWAVDYDCKRVRALVVYGSRDVLLKDFRVERSGFWTISLTYCDRVHVDGVVIRNNIGGFGPSSDGIDTDSSRDILVENCDIDCNDDNLCIKAGRDWDGLRVNRPAENIVYRNSVTRAGHGLFTLGSETSGGMRNIEVYGLRAEGTNTGIRFKSARVRGGLIEDIWFHDIEMDGVRSPLHFELDWYPSYSYPVIPDSLLRDSIPPHWVKMTTPVEPPEKGIPLFRNLRISHVTALNARTAIYVNAFPEKPISGLKWEHVYVQAGEAGLIRNARDWTMEDVRFEVPDRIRMENCENVDSPVYLSGQEEKGSPPAGEVSGELPGTRTTYRPEEVFDLAENGGELPGMIALDGQNRMITPGDTLASDTIRVFILSREEQDLSFYEPLGDGFYHVPAGLRTGTGKHLLSVSGEQAHHWIFYIRQGEAPGGLSGADRWSFHPEGWLEACRDGSAFRLELD
jgi:hypothetical protein